KGMLVGTLMDKATGEQVLIDGKPVVETKVFDVTKPDFEQQIEFIIDGTQAEGKTLVVFEKLYQVEVDKDGNVTKEKKLTEHEDINDEAQTVLVPKVETTAKDAESGTHTGKQREEITIKDDVIYTNLRSGKTYTVKGKLYKAVYNAEGDISGEEAYLDENGNEVTAEKTFKAEAKDGKVTLEFTFKGIVTGETIVAFEELYHNDELFAVHTDIYDKPQTSYYPEIKTRAKGANDTQFITEGKDATITDTIDYKSVEPNKTYVAEGTLYDKTTGKLTDITAQSGPFTPEKANGSVEVTFNFDATGLGNHIMVVYEKLYQLEEAPKPEEKVTLPKKPVATHEDPNDEAQTIEVEKPETEKYVNKVVHEDLASFRETFTYDIMAYVTHDADAIQIDDRLVELLEFVSEEVSIAIHDSNNHHIHGTVAESGSMLLTETMMEKDGIKDYGLYTVKIDGQSLHVRIKDAKPYRGKWIKVSFDARIKNKYKTIDELRKLGALIKINDDTPILGTTKEHTGITNRASYTIEVDHKARYILDTNIVTVIPPSPKISTTLALADGQKKAEKNGKVQLIDHIQYENLEIGETYRIEGRLVDEFGKTIQIHGMEIKVAIDEFIPKERNGSVDIVFMLDSSALKTNKVIAFEKLYIQGREEVIARHEDLDDEAQTFYFVEKPKIPTKPIVNTNDPSHIQKMTFLLGISIVIFFMALHTKHRYR
ncbi:MAG: VaFE repeat-containing surface-anchored protein, partial [Solobacterium sp.]|nr:VaFE repeat-containing surface-anchored protein [Solobacterium sp.]